MDLKPQSPARARPPQSPYAQVEVLGPALDQARRNGTNLRLVQVFVNTNDLETGPDLLPDAGPSGFNFGGVRANDSISLSAATGKGLADLLEREGLNLLAGLAGGGVVPLSMSNPWLGFSRVGTEVSGYYLVSFEPRGPVDFEPKDPDRFARDLAVQDAGDLARSRYQRNLTRYNVGFTYRYRPEATFFLNLFFNAGTDTSSFSG